MLNNRVISTNVPSRVGRSALIANAERKAEDAGASLDVLLMRNAH